MPTTQYVALLRGINVGGASIIRMADLKACFEARRLQDVATYIQSGNVLFATTETDNARLARRLEKALAGTFSPYKARLVLCSHATLAQIVEDAPKQFGAKTQTYRYDVMYLREPLTPAELMSSLKPKEGVDRVFGGSGVVYLSRLIARASESRLSRMASLPQYQDVTVRNWSTTTKLLALMESRTRRP